MVEEEVIVVEPRVSAGFWCLACRKGATDDHLKAAAVVQLHPRGLRGTGELRRATGVVCVARGAVAVHLLAFRAPSAAHERHGTTLPPAQGKEDGRET